MQHDETDLLVIAKTIVKSSGCNPDSMVMAGGEPIRISAQEMLYRFTLGDMSDSIHVDPDVLHLLTKAAGTYDAILYPNTAAARKASGRLADFAVADCALAVY